MAKISVIGAGAWGTTLAILLAENKHEVCLWAYEKELAQEIEEFRENKRFLPGFQLPSQIQATNEREETKDTQIYIFVVPTQHLRSVAKSFKYIIQTNSLIVCASKGIEEGKLKLPLEILKEELKTDNLAALSGPNLSREIAQGLPAATVVASEKIETAQAVQKVLLMERFRVYTNAAPLGVQLAGALKNVIAIAAGVVDGLEMGDNAKAGLLIRGLAEITRLGVAMGAKPETFAGLAGMGDLITTCGSKLSRNHCVGKQIAKGKKLNIIMKEMSAVAEGIPTTKAALALAKKHKIILPIMEEVNQLLFEEKSPSQAITDLLTREAKSE